MSRCEYRIQSRRSALRDMCPRRDRLTTSRRSDAVQLNHDAGWDRTSGSDRDGGGRGRTLVDGVKGSTSIGCLLFSFPLLAPLRISPRRPIGIELHVQLPLSARQLVILGLLLAAERMPLYRERAEYGKKTEKCTVTVDATWARASDRRPAT